VAQQFPRDLGRAVAEGDNADAGGIKGPQGGAGIRLRVQFSEIVEQGFQRRALDLDGVLGGEREQRVARDVGEGCMDASCREREGIAQGARTTAARPRRQAQSDQARAQGGEGENVVPMMSKVTTRGRAVGMVWCSFIRTPRDRHAGLRVS
jgi:hypothetical protein